MISPMHYDKARGVLRKAVTEGRDPLLALQAIGFAVVPIDPTEPMVHAADHTRLLREDYIESTRHNTRCTWAAMVDVAIQDSMK